MDFNLHNIFSVGKQGLSEDGIFTWLRFFFVYTEFLKLSFHNQRVLDVACGDGRFLQWARKEINYDRQYLGLVRGDASSLPFRNESFDIVFTIETLEHLTNIKRAEAITEIARVSCNHIIATVPMLDFDFFLVTILHNLLQKLGLVEKRQKLGFRSIDHKVEFFHVHFKDLIPLSSLVYMFYENGFLELLCREFGWLTRLACQLLKINPLTLPVSHPWLTTVMMRFEKAFSKTHFPFGHFAILHFQNCCVCKLSE
jgi:SAM-dependent methyltransferase